MHNEVMYIITAPFSPLHAFEQFSAEYLGPYSLLRCFGEGTISDRVSYLLLIRHALLRPTGIGATLVSVQLSLHHSRRTNLFRAKLEPWYPAHSAQYIEGLVLLCLKPWVYWI